MTKRKTYKLKLARGKTLLLGEKTLIMGILNVTPDSFSDGGKFKTLDRALKRAMEMVEEGVDIIDVGGESTRPGSSRVSLDEELKRVIPVIKEIRKKSDIPISIDTYKSKVAEEALKFGADIVNDVSSLRFDEKMVEVIKKYSSPIILMHMKGEPKTMQKSPHYNDLFGEIINFFKERVEFLENNGVPAENIIIDPGIGFGKTFEDNYRIIANLKRFMTLKKPILVGASRKSFLSLLDNRTPDKRIEGTAVSTVFSIIEGAHIVRVHDVSFMKRIAEFTELFLKFKEEV